MEVEADDLLWESICSAFFSSDQAKELSASTTTSLKERQLNIEDVKEVIQTLERWTREPQDKYKETHFRPGTVELLHKLGGGQDETGSWSFSRDRLMDLERLKVKSRSAFHTKITASRYSRFVEQLAQHITSARKQLNIDLEGGYTYQETSEMASAQREGLRAFLQQYGMQPSFSPVVNALFKVFKTQVNRNSNVVVAWKLDDAALVERGDKFTQDAMKLLVTHCRFIVHDFNGDSVQATRTFVVDPQLSDQRLNFLLALFPVTCYETSAPSSGTLVELSDSVFSRTNVNGDADAKCPQDSFFYPILSRCEIL